MNSTDSLVRELHGPILILGASGFVGANLMRTLMEVRSDVFGTASRDPAWRLAQIGQPHVITVDLLARGNLTTVLDRVQPGTVFDCVAYGAYSFELDTERMYQTNVVFKQELVEQLLRRGTHCYIHAGSSSEYGADSAAPDEAMPPTPNSHYAVTKNAAASLVYFSGHHRGLRCANLRLYSVYGPLEDRSRLIPTLVASAAGGLLPPFVDPDTSRDFVYVDDVTRCRRAAPGSLWELVQYRDRPQDHHSRTRISCEGAIRCRRGSSLLDDVRARLGCEGLVRQSGARQRGIGLARGGYVGRRVGTHRSLVRGT
jgi:dolichol-phosphate mannosyltransferase